MEIINKQEASDRDLFKRNTYMLVGCYMPHSFLPLLEKHIFVVPIRMFKKEQLMSQWIYENNYYTKSDKVDIPLAISVKMDTEEYAVLPYNVPLELKESPNENIEDTNVEWYFSINNIPIGCVITENLKDMKYIFCDGILGDKLFNLYKALMDKMNTYPEEILEKYNLENVKIEGLDNLSSQVFM